MNNPMQGAAQSRERARFALQHGDPANAERAFVQLLQVAPNDPEAVQFLASRHVLQGQAGQAVALLAIEGMGPEGAWDGECGPFDEALTQEGRAGKSISSPNPTFAFCESGSDSENR